MKYAAGKQRRPKKWSPSRRIVFWSVGGVLALLVLANFALWLHYRGKILPNVSLGAAQVGNISYDELNTKVPVADLLVDSVKLTTPDTSEQIAPADLGVAVDWDATKENLKKQRSFFPLANLFVHRTVPVELTVNDAVFDAKQAELTQLFHKNPLPERAVFRGENFEKANPEAGYQVNGSDFKPHILAGIKLGERIISVPTEEIPALQMTGGVDEAVALLRKKLQTEIKLNLNGTVIRPSKADIGSWFRQDGANMSFAPEIAKSYVAGLGSVYNAGNAASAIGYALDRQTDTTFMLSTTRASSKYTYCAATKGVDQSHLPNFIAKTAAVLGDPRGWNLGGKVGFERVESDCDFSLWLSAPSQMTSFGGLCDNYYSCRSGRNVVINFDRWQGATDPWNTAGGSLEDYRVMVTNHEVGHWLGFGHRNCTSPGQPAPVMQQQSIDLQGCKFNPWPTEPELATLKQNRGIAALPAREEFVALGSCCSCGHCSA